MIETFEAVMQVISDNRAWILSLILVVGVPVVIWMVWKLIKDGIEELKS
jgi:hypothetical protein